MVDNLGLSSGAESGATSVPRAADPDATLVWHYTDGAGLLSILRSNVVWATSAAFLNDQSEVALGFELIGKRLRELAVEDGRAIFVKLAEQLDRAQLVAADLSSSVFFILSASQHWDSLAMWRCYGGAAESYAIGLDPASPLLVLDEHAGDPDSADLRSEGLLVTRQPWQPVRYTAPDQRALVDAVFDEMPEQIASVLELGLEAEAGQPETRWGALPGRVEELLDELEQALLLIKHEGFADERETRYSVVVWPARDDPAASERLGRLVSHRATGYGVTPYLRLTGADPDNQSADRATVSRTGRLPIRAVAVSPSPNGSAATSSLRQLLAANGYGDAAVLRSAIPFRAG